MRFKNKSIERFSGFALAKNELNNTKFFLQPFSHNSCLQFLEGKSVFFFFFLFLSSSSHSFTGDTCSTAYRKKWKRTET